MCYYIGNTPPVCRNNSYVLGLHVYIQTPCTCAYTDTLYMCICRHPVHVYMQTPCTCVYADTLYMCICRHPVHSIQFHLQVTGLVWHKLKYIYVTITISTMFTHKYFLPLKCWWIKNCKGNIFCDYYEVVPYLFLSVMPIKSINL